MRFRRGTGPPKGFFMPGLLSLFLILALIIPAPSYALRQVNGPQAAGVEEGLTDALNPNPFAHLFFNGKTPTLDKTAEAVSQVLQSRAGPIQIREIIDTLVSLVMAYDDESESLLEKERDRKSSQMSYVGLHYTSKHMQRTSRYALEIFPHLPKEIQTAIGDPALMALAMEIHDVGKIFIDRKILYKGKHLTETEFEQIKTHARLGAELVEAVRKRIRLDEKTSRMLDFTLPVIRYHHEYYNRDPKGYPARVSGEELPLAARLAAIVDVMDALTAERPYRLRQPMIKTLEMLLKSSGSQFDPAFVRASILRYGADPKVLEEAHKYLWFWGQRKGTAKILIRKTKANAETLRTLEAQADPETNQKSLDEINRNIAAILDSLSNVRSAYASWVDEQATENRFVPWKMNPPHLATAADNTLAVLNEAAPGGENVAVFDSDLIQSRPRIGALFKHIPHDLGVRMILWGDGSLPAEEIRALKNSPVTVLNKGGLEELAAHLVLAHPDASNILYIGNNPKTGTALRVILPPGMNVQVLDGKTGLEEIFLRLGVAQSVLDQINASGLEQQLEQLASA